MISFFPSEVLIVLLVALPPPEVSKTAARLSYRHGICQVVGNIDGGRQAPVPEVEGYCISDL